MKADTVERLRRVYAILREDGKFTSADAVCCAIAEIERLRAAQVGAHVGAGWQPIATAPKDGTLFLAYAEAGQHELPALFSLCAWHEDAGFCICELREPTHWQPLQPPPNVGADVGAVSDLAASPA